MAAFVNSVYLLFSFVFNFVDNLHHMVEHWEEESHATQAENDNSTVPASSMKLKTIHDDVQHIKEMNQYLTLFNLLRLFIFSIYLYFESKNYNITTYMMDNWLYWPSVFDKTALKLKVKQCLQWDSFRINIYSISLLIACEFINSLGNIWIYFICLNFGIMENLISILKGTAILIVAIPLCLDNCYLLLQKV